MSINFQLHWKKIKAYVFKTPFSQRWTPQLSEESTRLAISKVREFIFNWVFKLGHSMHAHVKKFQHYKRMVLNGKVSVASTTGHCPIYSSGDNHTDSFPSVFPETWQTCTHIYLYLYIPLNSYMSRITQRTLMVFKSSCMSTSPREVLRNIPKLRSQSRPTNSEAPGKEPGCWHVIF